MIDSKDLDQLCINTIRTLSIDAVQKANSGHPGTPTDRPTLLIVDSHIGYGAPHKQDTSEAHGEPLGSEEVRLAKEFFGWNPDAQFLVPDGVQTHFQARLGRRGAERHAA